MSYIDDIRTVAELHLPWEKLEDCNILITGATGLIGSCLVAVLMARKNRNYHVYASGRNTVRANKRFKRYANDSYFHFLEHDITLPLDSNTTFQYIIHAGSNASPNFFSTKPVEVLKSNTLGVINLMDYGIGHGLRRFLFVSSGEVYGEGDGRIFTEEYSGYVDCTSPRSCYPTGKRAAESLCASYSTEYGIETVIARPCHTYGPEFTEADNRAYAQFIRNVLAKEDIIMKSNGAQYRSWCYVVDCVSALLHILLKGEAGKAYNIADETSNITIKELATMIAEIGGQKVVTQLPTDVEMMGANPVTKSIYSAERLKSLGWRCRTTMRENLQTTINHLLYEQ